jgi:hypothetical protein
MTQQEKTMMTQLKILTTAAGLVLSLASTPVLAQVVRAPFAGQNQTYDNSGWNGYNDGGYNNTWFDGRNYRSDPKPLGEDIASDPAGVAAPLRGYAHEYK